MTVATADDSLRVVLYGGTAQALAPAEEITALDACPDYFCAATSLGRLLFFDIDGNFVTYSHLHVGAVNFVCINGWTVVTAGVDGKVLLYDWIEDTSLAIGDPLKRPLSLCFKLS